MTKKESHLLLFSLLLLIGCLARIASDIYAPSIPMIAKDLHGTIDMVQFSMSIYMLGVSLSQLIYGPVSEGVGRKIPILTGLLIMSSGSIINIFSTSINILILGRFIEGLGAGACSSLWRTIARDTFKGEELAKKMSYLVVFFVFIIPAAPLLGGYIDEIFGWRANFIFMAFYAILAFIISLLKLKETNRNKDKKKLKISYIKENFIFMLKSRSFMQIAFAILLTYGAFFAWFLVGPVLLIKKLGVSPSDFGWINFIGLGGSFFTASLINGQIVSKAGTKFMLRMGWNITILSGFSMLIIYMLLDVDFWGIIIPMMFFAFGATFIFPNAFAVSFTPFGDRAGYAAAIYGSMQIGGGALIGMLISYLPDENQLYLAATILLCSSLAWLLYENAPKT